MLKAKKSLGQNFLRDKEILQKIVSAANVTQTDTILEVGPGEGDLTRVLLLHAREVHAIEKDSRAIPFLEDKFSDEITHKTFFLKEGDALEGGAESLIEQGKPYKIVANIPYYITGLLIKNFLEAAHKPQSITLVIQKEVAERIAVSTKESILSLSVKAFGTPEYAGTISKEAFDPVPKVDSAIIHIKNISTDFFEKHIITTDAFFRIIKLAFSQKRKTLIKNLSREYPREVVSQALEELDLDERVRAEDINLGNWGILVKKLQPSQR